MSTVRPEVQIRQIVGKNAHVNVADMSASARWRHHQHGNRVVWPRPFTGAEPHPLPSDWSEHVVVRFI